MRQLLRHIVVSPLSTCSKNPKENTMSLSRHHNNARPSAVPAVIDPTAVELPVPLDDRYLPVHLPNPPAWLGAEPIAPAGLVADDGDVFAPGQPDAISEVTDELFAADVAAIREAMDHARRTGRASGIGVAPDGAIHVDDAGGDAQRATPQGAPLSHVTNEVFAAPPTLEERRTASRQLPQGTLHTSQIPHWPASQPDGWIVRTTVDTGDCFEYLLYWSPLHDQYRASLISPAIERFVGTAVTAHDLHLYPDGTMCITDRIGSPTLESAYARAVLWCTGVAWSIRNEQPFPFNPDQAPLR